MSKRPLEGLDLKKKPKKKRGQKSVGYKHPVEGLEVAEADHNVAEDEVNEVEVSINLYSYDIYCN